MLTLKRSKNPYFIIPLFVLTLCIPEAASAHPGNSPELGLPHALLSGGHLLMFCSIGFLVGITTILKRRRSIGPTLAILIVFFGYQLTSHVGTDGLLFGLEVLLPGSLLTLIACQLTELTAKYLVLRFHQRKLKLVERNSRT